VCDENGALAEVQKGLVMRQPLLTPGVCRELRP
jgi:hypothetical protein